MRKAFSFVLVIMISIVMFAIPVMAADSGSQILAI